MGSMWCIIKLKFYFFKKFIFQIKGKSIKEKRNSYKLIVITSEMNNTLLIKGGNIMLIKEP